ncbi:VWA domain-containing protein [Sphingomonas sp. A2-49]|uniref:vWA domain-containing protein n=1 Tax=Sphingomonas sp. A2-49 TaxID=1391375 RepID=UPI0021CF01CB|nr:vWA domain-containing protein [Sphingomonas sp. A2-49]MCU6452715.1 VWA domain-containing protein [Sphingomonas sp. A2-49]
MSRALTRAAEAMRLRLRRALADRRGNVMMIMAFALIPMTFATGMAVDYSRAARLQTKLNAAADAASLAAVTKPMLDQPLQAACNIARQTFLNAVQQRSGGLTLSPADVIITVAEAYGTATTTTTACASSLVPVPSSFTKPTSRIVTVTYTGQSRNAFAGVLGKATIAIGGSAKVRAGLGGYYQIVFLVDVSNSMAIGGTPAAIAGLGGERTIQCAFACHDPNGLIAVGASSYCNANPLDANCRRQGSWYCPSGVACNWLANSPVYSDRRGLAKLYGYKLKIDYIRDALNSFMAKLQPTMDAKPMNYSVGLYTFGSTFAQLQPLTNSSPAIQRAINTVDIEVASRYLPAYANQGWTFTSAGLQSTLDSLTNIGDGSAPDRRKTYVILLSDGVEDDVGQLMYNRGTYYNYLQKCQAIKNANVTLFSIEASYPAITDDTDGQYTTLVGNLPSRNNGMTIQQAMQQCASSPDRFFSADDGPGIQTAVDHVFTSINVDTTRLTH